MVLILTAVNGTLTYLKYNNFEHRFFLLKLRTDTLIDKLSIAEDIINQRIILLTKSLGHALVKVSERLELQ